MNPSTDILTTGQAMAFQSELMREQIAAIQAALGNHADDPNELRVGAMSQANNLLCEALCLLRGEEA